MIYVARISFSRRLTNKDFVVLCGNLFQIDEKYKLEYSEIKPATRMQGKGRI